MKRSVVVVVAVVWALVLMGLGYWSFRTGRPTVREQTTIASALPTLDTALGRVAALLNGSEVPVLGGYGKVGGSCSITAARSGARYDRELDVYLRPGDEAALLGRVRAGLPADYRAGVNGSTLTADAGNFVAVKGVQVVPGEVSFTADTGCRPMPHPVVESVPAGDRTPVQALLDRLRLTGSGWVTHEISCTGGGVLRTVQATASGAPSSLVDALRGAPGSVVQASTGSWAASTSGKSGIVASVQDSRLVVSASSGCS